jgi:hypothetical protein
MVCHDSDTDSDETQNLPKFQRTFVESPSKDSDTDSHDIDNRELDRFNPIQTSTPRKSLSDSSAVMPASSGTSSVAIGLQPSTSAAVLPDANTSVGPQASRSANTADKSQHSHYCPMRNYSGEAQIFCSFCYNRSDYEGVSGASDFDPCAPGPDVSTDSEKSLDIDKLIDEME